MIPNKSAETRMTNVQKEAKQRTMVGNPAAQQSLRKQVSGAKKPVDAVQPAVDINQFRPDFKVALPSGGPALPPEETQGFDPEVFKEDMKDNIVGQLRTQQFANSPRVKDATTSIQIKEFFNRNNPNRKPDPRSLVDRVISRMGMKDV